VAKDYHYDTRLQEKSLRDGRLTREELDGAVDALKDATDQLVVYNAEGNPTNLPERTLKSLPVKHTDPDPRNMPAPNPADPLAGQWEDPVR